MATSLSYPELRAADWRAIGTHVRVVVTRASALHEARQRLVEQLAELDLACSRFRSDSEIVRLERSAGRTVAISPLLTQLLSAALSAAEQTNGDLDPTLGFVLAGLGYNRDFDSVPPDGPRLQINRHPAGSWRSIALECDRRLVRIPSGIRLDLGATAKAWAADRAASVLADQLACGVLVSLGGDVAVAGDPPAGGWPIRVQPATAHPDQPAPVSSAVVAITDGGLATSSVTARRWRRGGAVYHHILDPARQLPAAVVYPTVSVAAASALAANVASTTAVIRGAGARLWLDSLGVPARLVSAGGGIVTVGGWPRVPA